MNRVIGSNAKLCPPALEYVLKTTKSPFESDGCALFGIRSSSVLVRSGGGSRDHRHGQYRLAHTSKREVALDAEVSFVMQVGKAESREQM